jgi:outer membrane protein TolC
LNPQIYFYGNAPAIDKEYYGVRQPDGSISYLQISQQQSSLGMGISQELPFSGGKLELNSDLRRFDNFKAKTYQYSGTPVYIRLTQPVWGFNEWRWKKMIEPLKLQESVKVYAQEMEAIAEQIVNLFFDVIDAQSNMEIASANLRNLEINYDIEVRRINFGTTTEDKLLQLQLRKVSSQQELDNAKYQLQIAKMNLKVFAGMSEDTELTLLPPEETHAISLSVSQALNMARQNRAEFVAFKRKLNEAKRDVASAKSEARQINLLANLGLNNIGSTIPAIYKKPNDQQNLSVGFTVPIIDWGRNKSKFNAAKSAEQLIIATNEYDESTLLQEVTLLVKNIEVLQNSIVSAKQMDSIAQKRFAISNTLYQTGKLSISDFNIALTEKDESRRNYISALRKYWNIFYSLQKMTLYDLKENKPLLTE